MRSSVGRAKAAGACGTRTCDAAIEGAAQRAKTTGKMSQVSVDNRIFGALVNKRLLENHCDHDNDDGSTMHMHAQCIKFALRYIQLREGM